MSKRKRKSKKVVSEKEKANLTAEGRAKGAEASKKDINWDSVAQMCAIGCTQEEIAQVLKISRPTLISRCKSEQGMMFKTFYKQNNARFKLSLRRAQFKSAIGEKRTVRKTISKGEGKDNTVEIMETEEYTLRPSVQMLKWLGTQELGQREKVEVGKLEELLQKGEVEVDDEHAPD